MSIKHFYQTLFNRDYIDGLIGYWLFLWIDCIVDELEHRQYLLKSVDGRESVFKFSVEERDFS